LVRGTWRRIGPESATECQIPSTPYTRPLAPEIWRLNPGILRPMLSLILATEAVASTPPGDAYQTVAYVLLGLTMLVTAIATLIVTPGAEKH
jgi:hypothetical protein